MKFDSLKREAFAFKKFLKLTLCYYYLTPQVPVAHTEKKKC